MNLAPSSTTSSSSSTSRMVRSSLLPLLPSTHSVNRRTHQVPLGEEQPRHLGQPVDYPPRHVRLHRVPSRRSRRLRWREPRASFPPVSACAEPDERVGDDSTLIRRQFRARRRSRRRGRRGSALCRIRKQPLFILGVAERCESRPSDDQGVKKQGSKASRERVSIFQAPSPTTNPSSRAVPTPPPTRITSALH